MRLVFINREKKKKKEEKQHNVACTKMSHYAKRKNSYVCA